MARVRCFYAEHKRVAESFQEQFWVIADVSKAEGYGDLLPSRVEEASRTLLPQGSGVSPFFVSTEHLQGEAPTFSEIIQGLVEPIHCAQVQGDIPPSDRYWEDLERLTATWISVVDPTGYEPFDLEFEVKILSPDEASALATELRTCDYPHF